MGQVNIVKSSTFQIPPSGHRGYSFDPLGNPVIVLEDGTTTTITGSTGGLTNPSNIIADGGFGTVANLPETPVIGTIYATTDTFELYYRIDGATWQITEMETGVFITDPSTVSLYQFNGTILILLAGKQPDFNYVTFSGKGKTYYDAENDCLTTENEDGTKTQHGQELGKIAYTTDLTLVNGDVVYISGAEGGEGHETVSKCNIAEYNTSRVIGVLTTNVVDNHCRYTKFGDVNDLDTSLYQLGNILYGSSTNPAKWSTTRPTNSNFVVFVGIVTKVHATQGRISVSPSAEPYTVETVQKTGWSEYNIPDTFTANNTTREVAWSKSGGTSVFYQKGVKFPKDSDSIIVPNLEGLFVLYYNDAGEAQYIHKPNNSQIASVIQFNTTIAYVYWNAAVGQFEYKGAEFHTIEMPGIIHTYLHFNFKARWSSGLALNTIVADGNGNSNSHAQFGIDAGAIVDEDIYIPTLSVASTVGLPIFYIAGTTAAPMLRKATRTGYSFLSAGTGRAAYNQISGGAWQLIEATNNNFILGHVFGINEWDVNGRAVAMVGQNQYTTAALAIAGAKAELKTIEIAGLVPSEMKSIGTVVIQTSNTYNNTPKARIISIDASTTWYDWRDIQTGGGSGGSQSSQTVYSDADFKIFDNADATKSFQFEASNIPTGTNVSIPIPAEGGKMITESSLISSLLTTAKTVVGAVNELYNLIVNYITRGSGTVDLGSTGGTVTVNAALGVRFLINTNADTTPSITNPLPNYPIVIAYTVNHTINPPTSSGVTFKELVRDTPSGTGDKYDCWIYFTSATTANYSYIKIN